jgi:hypothetical protein
VDGHDRLDHPEPGCLDDAADLRERQRRRRGELRPADARAGALHDLRRDHQRRTQPRVLRREHLPLLERTGHTAAVELVLLELDAGQPDPRDQCSQPDCAGAGQSGDHQGAHEQRFHDAGDQSPRSHERRHLGRGGAQRNGVSGRNHPRVAGRRHERGGLHRKPVGHGRWRVVHRHVRPLGRARLPLP